MAQVWYVHMSFQICLSGNKIACFYLVFCMNQTDEFVMNYIFGYSVLFFIAVKDPVLTMRLCGCQVSHNPFSGTLKIP